MRKITDAELAHVYGAWSMVRPIHHHDHKQNIKHKVNHTAQHPKPVVKPSNKRPMKW